MFLSIQLHSFLYVYKITASPHQKDGSTQVTAYSEQTFLERLKKKQEAEESLRMGSGVSDTKLRDAVTNIGASSSSIGRDKSKTSDGGNSSSSSSNSISSRSALSKNRGDKTSTTSSTATSKGGGSGENKSSKSTASSSRSGKSNGSKSGGTAAGNAKDNPKLIKNFFQSLLNPKEKKEKRRSSSRNKSSK
jgi:hypothetical protein